MFTSRDALTRGWDLFRENAGLLIGVHLFVFLLHTPQASTEWLFPGSQVTKGLIVFATVILSFVTSIGLICIMLTLVDGGAFVFSDVFSRPHLVFKYLLDSILYGVIVAIGLILLIVPGNYLGSSVRLVGFLRRGARDGPNRGTEGEFGSHTRTSIGVDRVLRTLHRALRDGRGSVAPWLDRGLAGHFAGHGLHLSHSGP